MSNKLIVKFYRLFIFFYSMKYLLFSYFLFLLFYSNFTGICSATLLKYIALFFFFDGTRGKKCLFQGLCEKKNEYLNYFILFDKLCDREFFFKYKLIIKYLVVNYTYLFSNANKCSYDVLSHIIIEIEI